VTLQPGAFVGRYEVIGAIGAGGMGAVYRARDTRLNRVVAIKVLLRGLSDDPRRRERFEREAQAISRLSHPHICTLHDVGRHEGVDYLVMELLEGQTLAERIRAGPLPLEQAIRYGVQIAAALDAAHQRGIVHRDLKPANVFLARSSQTAAPVAKLLDFGIAKTVDSASGSATDQATLTDEGVVLGTIQYMAPEQLEGRPADARSDLFAFGAVLYEMLTGQRAFAGESPSKIIAAVLDAEPPALLNAQPLTPPTLEHVVMTCLAKSPDERWQSAADVRRQVEWIATTVKSRAEAPVASATVARPSHLISIVAAAVALGVVAMLGLLLWQRQSAQPVPHETRLEISTPPTTQPWSMAISPDGQTIAFVADADGKPMLWVRPLNAVEAQPLRGTSEATDPFWSPDSRTIGFFAAGKLKRIDLAGGDPQALADAIQPHGGAWERDGTILFAPHQLSPLLRVSADGGAPAAATTLADGQSGHVYPRVLPDGQVLFFVSGRADVRGAYVGRLDGTPAKRLLSLTEPAEYASNGYLLFLRDSSLFAQSLDLTRQQLTGSPVHVADRVAVRRFGSALPLAAISASDAGPFLYRGAGVARGRQLTWYDRSGKAVVHVGDADPARSDSAGIISISPDGQQVALSRRVGGDVDVWILDLRRGGAMTRLTNDPASEDFPLWAPNGLQVTFGSTRTGKLEIYQRALGSSDDKRLFEMPHNTVPAGWSPDGRVLLCLTADPNTHLDVWALPVAGEGKPFPVVQTPYEDLNPQFSPDGKWIAYQSSESSRHEIYIRPFGGGTAVPVSTEGGTQPRWRRDGKELYYLGLDRRLWAVPLSYPNASVSVGKAVALFQTSIGGPGLAQREYEVSPDGQRFLIDSPLEAVATPIVLLQNWKP